MKKKEIPKLFMFVGGVHKDSISFDLCSEPKSTHCTIESNSKISKLYLCKLVDGKLEVSAKDEKNEN
jgi:hypothetical protein